MRDKNVSCKEMEVKLVSRQDISNFIEQYHYSHNINGCISDYCFALYYEGEMIGAAFFGRMAMANQWKRFSDEEKKVTELRRLVCIDDTPKNTESYFIGKMLKWLRRNTELCVVVSYADAEYGHSGTIYRASNFTLEGFRKGAKVIVWGDKQYHDKAVRTKYKGELKPFAKKLKEALSDGTAYYKDTKGKWCYVYKLR